MITVLTGDNSFEIRRRVLAIKSAARGEVESIDGDSLAVNDLPSLLLGMTLFNPDRTIILKHVAANSGVWAKLAEYISKIDDKTSLVIVEPSLDKRTKTYKELKAQATIETYEAWTYRDESRAINWVIKTAEDLGLKSNRAEAKHLVDRVGYDQWQLDSALQKLALIGSMSRGMIDTIVEEDVHANVFQLLETVLLGSVSNVVDMTNQLERTEEPYKIFGLLFSQLFQLVALASAPSVDVAAKDLKLHPYAAKKQSQLASRVSQAKLDQAVKLFAESDQSIRFARPDQVWAEVTKLLVAVCQL
ncbi:MAG: DNA polymerase III subunit delta [bacterium]|nr:DNA polymerase III subunit delta [bacterium]MDN5835220.1 DNA polymerase III subunit delta [bacterium]